MICLFVLRFNALVNYFSVMSGRSYRFLGFNQYSRELMCLAQGHNSLAICCTTDAFVLIAHALTEIFLALKIENFHRKKFEIFLIFAQNIGCGYTLVIPLHTPVLRYKSGV